ncbi:MAG TPA: DUF1360 domain-containing protein [Rickettsiales bacterium]|nr:DUF1360 domain-containing protein [Rickettsiales bacterium]
MLSDYSFEMQFLLCALAVWRLSHFLVAEDGPWDIVIRLRASLGNSMMGQIMDCFYCTSIWIAIPFTLLIARSFISGFILWLALSGAACLLEQMTQKKESKS